MVDLFEIVDSLFNKEKYKKIPKKDIEKEYFMIMRILSNKMPVTINNLDTVGTNKIAVIDHMATILGNNYRSKPQWAYIPSFKKDKNGVHGKLEPLEKKYKSILIDKLEMGSVDYDDWKRTDPDDLLEVYKSMDEQEKKLKKELN